MSIKLSQNNDELVNGLKDTHINKSLQKNEGAEAIRKILDKGSLPANVNAGKSTNKQTNPIKTDKKRYHAPLMNRCDVETVNFKLGKLGVDVDLVSCCVKAAMSKGLINLTGDPSDLEQLIIEGEYFRHKYEVYLKDLLYQPDYRGSDYENGASESPVICICCSNRVQEHKSLKDNDVDKDGKYADKDCREEDTESEESFYDSDDDEREHVYVTRICEGYPKFDSGKFHNHCTECEGFGQCIGDYREAHCPKCDDHWFRGMSGFPCDNCGGDTDDSCSEY